MTTKEILDNLNRQFPDAIVSSVAEGLHPHVQVKPERLTAVCGYLKAQPGLKFDLLRCITAVDWPAKNAIELSYDLISVETTQALAVKVSVDRARPRIASVSAIWPAANWHEREAFDLMGVAFENHPDLRRILMPEDWEGHPLRKDYQDPVEYHGISVKPCEK